MNLRGVLLCALATLLVACGPAKKPDPIPPDDAGSSQDAGPQNDAGAGSDAGLNDAGPLDAGAPCDRAEACVVGWTEPEHFPTVVDHHTTFVHRSDAGTFLYVVGGVSNTGDTINAVYDTVRRAKIRADGSLDAWEAAGVMPQPIAFHTQAKVGNRVYLLGGISNGATGTFASGLTFMGTLDDAGAITWQKGSSLTAAVLHGTAAILGDKLYLIGGSAQFPKADVVVSTLGPDGLNGPWTAGPSLPTPRSHHAAVVHGGQIFLLGGFDSQMEPISDVLRSQVDANGVVTGWDLGGELPSAPWTSAASLWGDSVFMIGGGEGGANDEHYVARVRRARFFPNNTLDAFVDVAPLPTARSHVHFSPIFDGRIYSVGGRLMPSGSSMDRIFIGAFQPSAL